MDAVTGPARALKSLGGQSQVGIPRTQSGAIYLQELNQVPKVSITEKLTIRMIPTQTL